MRQAQLRYHQKNRALLFQSIVPAVKSSEHAQRTNSCLSPFLRRELKSTRCSRKEFSMGTIDRAEGRRAFGADPEGYHAARPAYPERVFEILRQRCGLRPSCRTFEIGGGTGVCTRRLVELGASPLVVVEPDARLAAF